MSFVRKGSAWTEEVSEYFGVKFQNIYDATTFINSVNKLKDKGERKLELRPLPQDIFSNKAPADLLAYLYSKQWNTDFKPQETARILLKHLTAISTKDGCESDVNLFAMALITLIQRPDSRSGFCYKGRGGRDHPSRGPGNKKRYLNGFPNY